MEAMLTSSDHKCKPEVLEGGESCLRLLNLEEATNTINAQLVTVDDELEGNVTTAVPRKYS